MHHNTTKPTARSRAHAQRMAALANTGSAGSYQPVALTPLYGTPPPCVFLGAGPKPKSIMFCTTCIGSTRTWSKRKRCPNRDCPRAITPE